MMTLWKIVFDLKWPVLVNADTKMAAMEEAWVRFRAKDFYVKANSSGIDTIEELDPKSPEAHGIDPDYEAMLADLAPGPALGPYHHADPCDDESCPCRKAEADDWRDHGGVRH